MKFRTKLFLTSSAVVVLLWAGALWPIQRMVVASFDRQADANFAGIRRSLRSVQDDHISHMRQIGSMVMVIPELRALIAEHNFELSSDNLASLQERLDGLTDVMGAKFICVMDGRGALIAQNSSSPWSNLGELRGFMAQSAQAQPLVRRLFTPSTSDAQNESAQYGLWVYDGQLYQVVGLPLLFSSEANRAAPPDGVLIMAEPMTNDLAQNVGASHQCDVSFLANGQTLATSLSAALERKLLASYRPDEWPSAAPFDVTLGAATYRAYMEPTIDPCSKTTIGATIFLRSLSDVQALQRRISVSLLAIMAGGLLVASLASFLLSGAVTRPIRELVKGVRRVAEGDLNSTIPHDSRDELGELAAAFNDMVTQLRTRRELQRLVEESQAASKAKSFFLANMSHEIRTPLHGVIGMANLLLGTDLNERQRHYVELVKSSTEVLTTLINDILDFSKIEAGKLDLETVDFDPHAIVEDVVELLSQKALAKGVEIAADISIDVPTQVRGDPNRLRQILLNLIGNAVKFTDKGQVIVRVERPHSDEQGEELKFAVCDTGIGIPADRLDRLFKSFSQVDASTTRRFGGTGLGLAISKQLIELMGGGITVDSQSGKGSTFRFTLKFAYADNFSGILSPRLAGLRVLVAEGNQSVREIVCRYLNEAGVETYSAATAYEAAQQLAAAQAAAKPFAALLVDRRINGADALLASRRQEPGHPRPTALLLTEAKDHPAEERFGTADVSACVHRPVRRTHLLATIASALGIKSLPATSSPPQHIQPSVRATRLRILVAEDNEVNQLVALELLTKAGFEPVVVADGQSAVRAIQEGTYDLVLMDCQMPVMDGLEAARLIRQNEAARQASGQAHRPVPIVALTANASGADRERCLEAGMNAYCGKPYRPHDLLQVIESLLPPDRAAAVAPPLPVTAELRQAASRPTVASNIPPCDVKALLNNCTGNAALAMKILEKFEKQTGDVLSQIEQCLSEKNADLLARVSHATKGTAGTMAADALRHALAEMEKIGRTNTLDEGEKCLANLREEIMRFSSYIPQVRTQLRDISGS